MPAQLDATPTNTPTEAADAHQTRDERLRQLGYRFPTGRHVQAEKVKGRAAAVAFVYRLLSKLRRR